MGWEGRLHRYPYPSVSRLAIYTDRYLTRNIKSPLGLFLYIQKIKERRKEDEQRQTDFKKWSRN